MTAKEIISNHLEALDIEVVEYNMLVAKLIDFENEVIDETLQKLYDDGAINDRMAFHSMGRYIKNK